MLHVPITLTSCVSNASAIFLRHVSTIDTSLCSPLLIIRSDVRVVVVADDDGVIFVKSGRDTAGSDIMSLGTAVVDAKVVVVVVVVVVVEEGESITDDDDDDDDDDP